MQKTVRRFSLQQYLWDWLCRWFCCWFLPTLFICWSTWNLLTGTMNAKLHLLILHRWKTVTWEMRKSHWEAVEMSPTNLETNSSVKFIFSSMHLFQWNWYFLPLSPSYVVMQIFYQLMKGKVGNRMFSVVTVCYLSITISKMPWETRWEAEIPLWVRDFMWWEFIPVVQNQNAFCFQPAYQILKTESLMEPLKLNKDITNWKKKICLLILSEDKIYPAFVFASSILLCVLTKCYPFLSQFSFYFQNYILSSLSP